MDLINQKKNFKRRIANGGSKKQNDCSKFLDRLQQKNQSENVDPSNEKCGSWLQQIQAPVVAFRVPVAANCSTGGHHLQPRRLQNVQPRRRGGGRGDGRPWLPRIASAPKYSSHQKVVDEWKSRAPSQPDLDAKKESGEQM